jgi:hypothetical protein
LSKAGVRGRHFNPWPRKLFGLRPPAGLLEMWQIFSRNIFASLVYSSIMETIGAIALRLHGFHRFLPRLWELFYCAVETDTATHHPLGG